MGAGVSAIMPILSVFGKVMGGAGGGGGGQAMAAPSPWDAAISGQPNPAGAPPPPEQNPMFASDRDLFGGAMPIKPTPPIPAMKGNALFDEQMSKPGSPAKALKPPMPMRRPQSPDEMAQGPDGSEYGMFLDAQAQQDQEDAITKSLPGMFNTTQTAAKSAPVNSLDKRTNTERFSDAGWTLDSATGQEVPKTGNALFDMPMPARKMPEADATAPQASAPKLDRGLFDMPQKTRVVPDEEDQGNGVENGLGLLPNSVGEPIGQLQDVLGDSATNPLFQAGMSLLASGHDGSNPWKMMAGNLAAIPAYQNQAQAADLAMAADERANKDQARQDRELALKMQHEGAMAELAKLLAAAGMQTPGSNAARGSAKVIR